jgi:hypothetical protein
MNSIYIYTILLILLIIIITSLIYLHYLKINITHNNLSVNSTNIDEGFTTNSIQYGNVIYAADSTQGITKNINNDRDELLELDMGAVFRITDIMLTGNISNKIIRISVFNSTTSKNNYININSGGSTITDKITLATSEGNTDLAFHNIKTVYNTELIGDRINIYFIEPPPKPTTTTTTTTEPSSKPTTTTTTTNDTFSDITTKIKVCGLLSTENITNNDLDILDRKASIINTASNIYVNNLNNLLTILPNDTLYKITLIEFKNDTYDNMPLNIYYTNNYTKERMVHTSTRKDGTFLVTAGFRKIYIYDKILLANKLYIEPVSDNNNTVVNSNITIKGYKANRTDVTAFKLQNNLTDIRGSINPDEICPGIDGLLHDQLSAETIIDSLEYQEKIKDEKVKLQSNKEALLHLLEQQEKINRVAALINKIEDLRSQRERETDALNAIRLTRQIDEANRLKEVLDARIKQNEANTFNINEVRLNIIKNVDANAPEEGVATVEGFNDTVPTDENMEFK